MRNRFLGSILAMVAVLVVPPGVLAQTARPSGTARAQAPASTPDLSGVWSGPVGGGGRTGERGIGRRRWTAEDPPLQPWAMQIFKENRAGVNDPNEQGLDELDPGYNCIPPGTPRIFAIGRPFEIVQVPGRVFILYEWDHTVRRIYTDGRKHPEGYFPTYMGWSIGKWEGDTLVVDTVGLSDKTWIDGIGTPHSDELRVTERIRRLDRDTLEIEFRFDDPKAFTKPWGGKKTFRLRPDWEVLEHTNCEDHLIEEHLPKNLRRIGK